MREMFAFDDVIMNCLYFQENCVQYWPTRGSKEYGKFKVTLASMEKFAGYAIRILKVEYNGVITDIAI